MKRGLTIGLAVAIISLIPLASPASADQGGGGCVFNAKLYFSEGLALIPEKTFTYIMNGNLSQCQGIAAPASAVAFAGYGDFPPATGNGGCANASTHGKMIVAWADNTITIVNYGTAGPLAATVIQGEVMPALNGYRTTRFLGGSVAGNLTITPGNAPLDCAGGGVGFAELQGSISFASAS